MARESPKNEMFLRMSVPCVPFEATRCHQGRREGRRRCRRNGVDGKELQDREMAVNNGTWKHRFCVFDRNANLENRQARLGRHARHKPYAPYHGKRCEEKKHSSRQVIPFRVQISDMALVGAHLRVCPKRGQTRRSAPTEVRGLAHWTGYSYHLLESAVV